MDNIDNTLDGQSIIIAICKFIGTLCASMAFWFFTPGLPQYSNGLFVIMYVSTMVYDIIYIALILNVKKFKIQNNINKNSVDSVELQQHDNQTV